MDTKEMLCEMANYTSISGSESGLASYLANLLQEKCDTVTIDAFGNVIGIKKGKSGNRVLLDAHMDEVGLMVREILPNDTLAFIPIGGIDPRILPSCEVMVHGKRELLGVIGAKPPHLQTQGEDQKTLPIESLSIDIGCEKPSDLVRVGDKVSILSGFSELQNGCFSGKAMDNRCGVAALLRTMDLLSTCEHEVVVLFSVQEELGCIGAAAGAIDKNPDLAIVVDVTHGMTPDGSVERSFPLGSGVAVCTGPNIHRSFFQRILETAQKEGISYTIEVEGGDTGTNAGVIQLSCEGVPTVLLSIPLRYMHTPSEVVQLSDIDDTARLIVSFLGGDLSC